MKPKILIIVGPTASGKSSLGLELAKKFNGEILCVDSRTVYRRMDIGTAKDLVLGDRGQGTGEDCQFFKENNLHPCPLSPVPSQSLHGTNLVNPNQEMNGALFKEYAEKAIAEILDRWHLPILVGGTGLWMDMIVGNFELPEVGPDFELRAELEKKNEDELFVEYKKLDPLGAEVIDRKNKRRLIRALEVCKKTGRPFSEFRKVGVEKYDALWLGVDWPKEVLDQRINRRVDEMIKNGLVEEVRGLKEKFGREAYAMSGIGYQEICQYLDNEITLSEAIEEIKNHTRQYAKRQKTWFKRNKNIRWVSDVSETELIIRKFFQ